MRELVLGCGALTVPLMTSDGRAEYVNATTVDINANHNPTLVLDLSEPSWPFYDETFAEVHAYEVLEHLGKQGDAQSFFATFSEIWRVLKPEGILFASVPHWKSEWAWGDPDHKRVITPGSLVFLNQAEYAQVGATPMSDYRYCYRADFETVYAKETEHRFLFALKAIKPSRWAP